MKKLFALLLIVSMILCFSACRPSKTTETTKTDDQSKAYSISLWFPSDGNNDNDVIELTERQIEKFKELHPEYNITVTIKYMNPDDIANQVYFDLVDAPDIYAFASADISRLLYARALAPLSSTVAQNVINENTTNSIASATVDGDIYACPLNVESGYFLYYDSSVISDEQAKTLEGIIEACKAADKKFAYPLRNALYTVGFFFAQPVGGGGPLCMSKWTQDYDTGDFIKVFDTFNSSNGFIAMKAMNALANSGSWVDFADNFGGTAAVVTGIWNAGAAETEYGDNMRATKLPTYTVNGTTYQMGSFSAYNLLGCKPQTDDTKAKICEELVLFLTNKEAQLERYEELGWIPSNLDLQKNEDIMNNKSLIALLEQNEYAQIQGHIHGSWWDEAAQLGEMCQGDNLTNDDFIAALEDYEKRIESCITD